LNKIVGNLLSNALKFARKNIRISLRSLGDTGYTIQVQDDGIGIHPDHRELVFNPFYQAGKQSGQTGTGIGLSLVKSFADHIGGSIELESYPMQGTSFLFHFSDYPPLPELPNVEYTNLPDQEAQQVNNDLQRILVVEDNRDMSLFI